MTKPEIYSREFDRIDQQIAALQVYIYEAELYPEQNRPWTRFHRSVFLFLLRRYVFRQIQQLHLRRRAVRNCYMYVHKREPESLPLEDEAGLIHAHNQ